jgi:hypothetical protein
MADSPLASIIVAEELGTGEEEKTPADEPPVHVGLAVGGK